MIGPGTLMGSSFVVRTEVSEASVVAMQGLKSLFGGPGDSKCWLRCLESMVILLSWRSGFEGMATEGVATEGVVISWLCLRLVLQNFYCYICYIPNDELRKNAALC